MENNATKNPKIYFRLTKFIGTCFTSEDYELVSEFF